MQVQNALRHFWRASVWTSTQTNTNLALTVNQFLVPEQQETACLPSLIVRDCPLLLSPRKTQALDCYPDTQCMEPALGFETIPMQVNKVELLK